MAKDKNEAIPLKKGKATFNLVGKANMFCPFMVLRILRWWIHDKND